MQMSTRAVSSHKLCVREDIITFPHLQPHTLGTPAPSDTNIPSARHTSYLHICSNISKQYYDPTRYPRWLEQAQAVSQQTYIQRVTERDY
jgi:hypothetical protein